MFYDVVHAVDYPWQSQPVGESQQGHLKKVVHTPLQPPSPVFCLTLPRNLPRGTHAAADAHSGLTKLCNNERHRLFSEVDIS